MTDYAVYGSGKDRDGDITSLCGPWGSVSKNTAIFSIQTGAHSFHVPLSNGLNAAIEVVNGTSGPYLRTNWDNTTKNNLADLPYC